jgi:hypothetical protein
MFESLKHVTATKFENILYTKVKGAYLTIISALYNNNSSLTHNECDQQ